MYALMITDALLRVVTALVLLFIVVPALAYRRPQSLDRMQWFWWCVGFGVIALTWCGQLLSLVRSFSALPLILGIGLIILIGRARLEGVTVRVLWSRFVRNAMLLILNLLDGRISVMRRLRRLFRRTRARLRERLDRRTVAVASGWVAMIGVAAFYRFLRPFSTPNLGYSDAYPHLYLVQLLKQGIQIEPNYGPYPRGMHFLLLAIHELTNVDLTLLLNVFGSVVGVLIMISVADAARRLNGHWRAGLLAGALLAATLGGPSQYFLLGGAFQVDDPAVARELAAENYRNVADKAAEFDLLLSAFRRQTVTLPQELAIVLLFPAALFLLDWFRGRDRWHLAGFAICSAAIAAVHSGVVVALVILCAVSAIAAAAEQRLHRDIFRRSIVIGLAAVVAGSSWALGFIHTGFEKSGVSGGLHDTIVVYFPFLRRFFGERPLIERMSMPVYVPITPFVVVAIVLGVVLLVKAAFVRPDARGALVWPAAATLVFFYAHVASMAHLPQILPVNRNAAWLLMSIALLITKAIAEAAAIARSRWGEPKTRYAFGTMAAILVGFWLTRVPDVRAAEARELYYVDQTGYGTAAMTVLRIERELQPFTWTLVTYGQEFPMVLGKGFHTAAAEFLDRYDPRRPMAIPTRYVFIIVEKNPHPFEILDWAVRYSRAELQKRLQTWCYVYQSTHDNIRLYLEDENVRVYVIEQSEEDLRRLAAGSNP